MKKGFTIVELIISITLLSVVVVFMLSLMSELRNNESEMENDTDKVLNTIFISKKINGDVVKNEGISNSECTTTKCTLTFNNNVVKTIELTNDMKTLTYKENDKIELSRTLEEGTYKNINVYKKEYTYGTLQIITIPSSISPLYKIEIVSY